MYSWTSHKAYDCFSCHHIQCQSGLLELQSLRWYSLAIKPKEKSYDGLQWFNPGFLRAQMEDRMSHLINAITVWTKERFAFDAKDQKAVYSKYVGSSLLFMKIGPLPTSSPTALLTTRAGAVRIINKNTCCNEHMMVLLESTTGKT